MYSFLPFPLNKYVKDNFDLLRELRLRLDKRVFANIAGENKPVVYNGSFIYATKDTLSFIINSACNNSLYRYNENIKQGFIPCANGVRIGVCGECVYEDDCLQTIKNFNSLCIRFPHFVKGCAEQAFNIINQNNALNNTLIISKPGVGKTTLLKDLIRIISDIKTLNILVINEKNELFYDGIIFGETVDVITSCNKKFGFYNAIQHMNPNVIIADELVSEEDVEGVIFAIRSGVKVICSVHGNSLEDLNNKSYLKKIISTNCFEKYILLEKFASGFSTKEICKGGK